MGRPRPAHDGLRRRAPRQEPAGQHGRAGRGGAARGRRCAGSRTRACGSTCTMRSFEPGGHHYAPDVGRRPPRASPRRTRRSSSASTTTSPTPSCGTTCSVSTSSVLPYRFGTHSGWLEACYDLGTAVVAPTCGFYAEQQPLPVLRPRRGRASTRIRSSPRSARAYEQAPGPARRSVADRRAAAAVARRCAPGPVRAAAGDERAARRNHRGRPASRSPSRSRAVSRRTSGRSRDRLRRRGHDVTLFAGPGSDPRLGVELLDLRRPRLSAAAPADVSMTAPEWLDEHHAYLQLMIGLGRAARRRLRRHPQPQPALPAGRHGGDASARRS